MPAPLRRAIPVDQLILDQPDDWHVHLRDGACLGDTVAATARQFARAIVMPNLGPPVRTAADAQAYRERILAACPAELDFAPLMTLYLTDLTSPEDIDAAAESGIVHGVKLYPAGATTNSDSGVTRLDAALPALRRMAEHGLVLEVHGEVTDPAVDIFDREAVFIRRVLAPLLDEIPDLRVVLEHISTAEAVEFVESAGAGVAATITPQHLLLNRNALFSGGLRPHAWCLPVLKAERHREAVLAAAVSASPRFFLGTDSAPHARSAKESDCGCAGIFSAATALELYALAFEQAGELPRLEAFAAHYGADFYGLPRNAEKVRLLRRDTKVPARLPLGDGEVVPMMAGATLPWTFAGTAS